MMKVVEIKESVLEMWVHQEDGSDQLIRETVYLPTYEYTVNGRTYQYSSRQSLSGRWELGRQVVGYYDPRQPDRITGKQAAKACFGWDRFLRFCRVPALVRHHDIHRPSRHFLIPNIHNRCDYGCCPESTVCTAERDNK